MTGLETLRMPASLPQNFANNFANFASFSGALPISHFQIARIGIEGAQPTPPLPPLIRIDGGDVPERAPGLSLASDEASLTVDGYEVDWEVLNDILEMPPRIVEGLRLDAMDLVLARDAGWFEFKSLREVLSSKGLPPHAHSFFAGVFRANADRISAPSASDADPVSKAHRTDFLEYAKDRFLEGAFLSRMADEGSRSKAGAMLAQSAVGFSISRRFSAAAMMYELAADVQVRGGMSSDGARSAGARMWLAEARRGNGEEFDVVYRRALNALQLDHPGSGPLEELFDISAEHYLGTGDRAEAARSFVRKAWARIMKLDAPGAAPKLSPNDWFRTGVDLLTAAALFGHEKLDFHSSMARTLSAEASELGEEARNGPAGELLIAPSDELSRSEEPTVNFRIPHRVAGDDL